MSTPFDATTSVSLIRASRRVANDHQSGSWLILAVTRRIWSAWVARANQRDALMDLLENEHLRNDIGLTRDDVLDEINKPFWR